MRTRWPTSMPGSMARTKQTGNASRPGPATCWPPPPTLSPDDFTIVEETASGRIISSMNLIPQTWTYEGIEFGVGRPELVGTLPEFRNLGLVRMQFEEVHRRRPA